jgi:adenosylcobinamide kinase/adenosylcobinamide-phosphate guanylyltransferase
MAKIIFITGGAQSGKARWAANYLGHCDDVMYMCAYENLEKDIADRIAFNCDKNGINWNIQEGVHNPSEMVKGHKFSILDNLPEYTNRIINSRCSDLGTITPEERTEIENMVINEVIELIWEVKEIDGTLLILSVELGFCPYPADDGQKVFRKMMGSINQRIANQASEAYLLVSGIHTKLK